MLGGVETFVVRIWVPAGGGDELSAGALRGVLEHVASASSSTFAGGDELVDLLLGQLASRAGTSMRTTGIHRRG